MPEKNTKINVIFQLSEDTRAYFTQLGRCEANGVLIGKSIDVRRLSNKTSGRYEPVFVSLPANGLAIIFHYGVITFFNADTHSTSELIEACKAFTSQVYTTPETEQFSINIHADLAEGVKNDIIQVKEITKERLYIIGDTLSKSVMLDYHENKISSLFDQIEPIAKSLTQKGKLGFSTKMLLKKIGSSLLMSHDMVGKVEITEKPNILWDHVELEPLHAQLAEDLEIIERQNILDKKNSLIGNTVQISLEVLQQKLGHRLEWYIIVLIGIEILIDLYDKFISKIAH
jgi:uncharacterized Rmd1/YagE family protein